MKVSGNFQEYRPGGELLTLFLFSFWCLNFRVLLQLALFQGGVLLVEILNVRGTNTILYIKKKRKGQFENEIIIRWNKITYTYFISAN